MEKTRQVGLNEAKNDFVIFLTDDALPASDHLFYDMCEVFSKDKKIAVVTARQIPRSDSDLMSAFTLNEYYEHLNLNEDRIISTKNFDGLGMAEKRRTSQIDDVCSCYKRDVLSKYKFREIKTAEDLDVGIRLVKDGYKIAQLFSTGVIHSHIRPASYYLRRGFVETKVFSSLFNYRPFDFTKSEIKNLDDIYNHIFSLYHALNHTIDLRKQKKIVSIIEAFEIINKEMPKFYQTKSSPKSSDKSLETIFSNFSNGKMTGKSDSFLLKDYLTSLLALNGFLRKTYPNLSGIEDDFFDTLYKKFGLIAGDRLGAFVLFSEKQKSQDENLLKLEKVLESGF